jgi:hypothetical protein
VDEETAQSKDIKKFYELMKRLNPKLAWNVNTGSMREDSKANQLVGIQKQPSYAGLEEYLEAQKKQLESEVRCPDPNYFSIIDWNIVIQSQQNRKSPGPDSISYENWR